MVSVLTFGPKVRGFKPDRSDGLLRMIQIRNTSSFGEEVKPEAPCRKILGHTKTSTSMKVIFRSQNPSFPRPDPPDLLLDNSACRIARERSGGRIRSFPQLTSWTTVFHVHISPGG
jgi:hypothetical protein